MKTSFLNALKFILKIKTLITIVLIGYSTTSIAGNWSLGAGGLLSENGYRQTTINRLIIPFISYQDQFLSIYGPFAKIRYPINKQNIIAIIFQMGLQEYSPSQSSNPQMNLLEERKRLFYIGPLYRHRTNYGDMIANVSTDVTGRSHGGLFANLRYSYTFKDLTMRYFARPEIGLTWNNKKLNQHFYEISPSESITSQLRTYNPNSTVSPFTSLFTSIQITKKIYWTNIFNFAYIPKKINQSPMSSGRSYSYNIITGVTFELGEKEQRFNH